MNCKNCGMYYSPSIADTGYCYNCIRLIQRDYNSFKGWICAKCGRSYSPFTDECEICNNQNNLIKINFIETTELKE